MSTTDLLGRLRAGEPEAFQELVEHYQERVLNTCYRFVPNRADAEDLAQEVFVVVHQSVGRFRGESTLSTWLYRIAVSRSLDFIRRSRRKKRFGLIRRNPAESEKPEEEPPAPQPDPEAYTQTRERRQVLLSALDSLAESQRIAFTLSQWEGSSYLEIADVMGISLSAVESLIHRARKNLEKHLHAYYAKHM